MKKIFNAICLCVTFLFITSLAIILFTPVAHAEYFDVVADSSVNTLVGTTPILVKKSKDLCSKFRVWNDDMSCKVILYFGDPNDSSTFYYTIPADTVGTIDYVIPAMASDGLYVATTVTAGTTVDFIGLITKGYR